ncbi:hypothetical protein P171DRAFT_133698 [Karstenula rhodostoma CBS 690.94]|uniref:Uncharacterized protein n=1 Tax=Karstenula rhodostoma CBS 690.94 TaxID=1392251 RepID=A0A9P4P853_9PLEO|nr:hypothetical protein P171DRAFT_133698 [Karstenula rhodostoma CBS 690.94]
MSLPARGAFAVASSPYVIGRFFHSSSVAPCHWSLVSFRCSCSWRRRQVENVRHLSLCPDSLRLKALCVRCRCCAREAVMPLWLSALRGVEVVKINLGVKTC